MNRRVVITGIGVITPLGDTPADLFRTQLAGQSGVGPIQQFDARTFPTTFGAEVRDFDLARYVGPSPRWADAGAASRFAAAATQCALADAGLLDAAGVDRTRLGIYLGIGEGTQDFHVLVGMVARSYERATHTIDPVALFRHGLSEYHAGREYEQELHTPAAHLAEHFDLQGPNYSCLTACAAGTQAIGEAADLIRQGDADIILGGGAHSMLHPFGVTGFNLLTALSTRNDAPQKASRPFDRLRDGFVIGEGAGMLVLEELEHARRRGAVIHAELTGYGATCDAYRVTDSHPEGRGAVACMRRRWPTPASPPSISATSTPTAPVHASTTPSRRSRSSRSSASTPAGCRFRRARACSAISSARPARSNWRSACWRCGTACYRRRSTTRCPIRSAISTTSPISRAKCACATS